MEIEYSKPSIKFISAQDKPTKERIKVAIEGLTETPPKGDIKLMQGYTPESYRLRVGKYRILYRYYTVKDKDGNNQCVLYILDVGSRGDIYK